MKTLLWNHYACILGHLFVPGIGSLGLTRLLANANPGCPFICTLYKGGPLLCPPKEVQNLSRPIWEEYIEVLLPLLLGTLLGLDLETHTHTQSQGQETRASLLWPSLSRKLKLKRSPMGCTCPVSISLPRSLPMNFCIAVWFPHCLLPLSHAQLLMPSPPPHHFVMTKVLGKGSGVLTR